MSKPALKKALGDYTAKQLVDLILELYTHRPEAKEYLDFWLNPDHETAFDKYSAKLDRIFTNSNGKAVKKPDLPAANRLLKSFASLGVGADTYARLMNRYIVDLVIWMTRMPRIKTYIPRLENIIAKFRVHLEQSALEEQFARQLSDAEEHLAELTTRADSDSQKSRRCFRWFRY